MDNALLLARDLAQEFEGLSLIPYHDPVGFKTIGYGHLLSRTPWATLETTGPITHEEAERLLAEDMQSAAASVTRLVTVPLTDYQRAALIDFTFNCGAGNLARSTLLKVINEGAYDAAPAEFLKWVYARGKKLPGLVRRREAEVEYWNRKEPS